MKYAYFPGCSLHGTAKEYNMSTLEVCSDIGIELKEIKDWNCCGASSAHATNHFLSVALPARNLGIAEQEGLDVVAPCAACFNRLVESDYEIRNNEEMRKKVIEETGINYNSSIKIYSLVEAVLNEIRETDISHKFKKSLNKMKIASYYGCLLVRPNKITKFDDPENPQSIDNVVKVCGGEVIDWPFKTECCGASFSLSKKEVVLKLTNDILNMAKLSGAECIVTACPLCQSNLDMRQKEVEKMYGVEYNMPIFYITQLIGLALGKDPKKLGLDTHYVNTMNLLQRKEII